MTTNWALPTSIIQYAETDAEDAHVSWVDNFSALIHKTGRSVKTSRDLLHIAKQPKHDLVEKTYFIKASGFNFINLPDTVSGIEMKLSMKRHGRISDDTIQLFSDGDLIGDNQASMGLNPITIYGGETEMWNTSLLISKITNPAFGVVIRFRSHPNWPHKTGAMLDAVELRIH